MGTMIIGNQVMIFFFNVDLDNVEFLKTDFIVTEHIHFIVQGGTSIKVCNAKL